MLWQQSCVFLLPYTPAFSWSFQDKRQPWQDQEDELTAYQFHISGKKEGNTEITIIINHNDHKDFESKAIPIVVSSAG